MKTIAFIGLGTMGFSMAGHLANAGYNVTVYNRNNEKAKQWLTQYQGKQATTPAEAAAELIFICVGNDDDLREVMLGEHGLIHGVRPNSIVVDHTTASAAIARELYQTLATKQVSFIDAPVSGGQQGAETGKLTIMCGGDETVFNKALTVMQHYAQSCLLMGKVGSGQLTKMVNQISAAGVIQGLAEGMAFAQNAGLDCEKVYAAISKGAAGSWQMSNRYQTMLAGNYDHGFAVDWMRKDLAICLEEAKHNGSQLPLSEMVDQFYAEVQKNGGGRWDTSALLTRLSNTASEN